MAPQDDLTAERAATDMYNRLFSLMSSPEHKHHAKAKARLKLFYQVTRQEALREAADFVDTHELIDPSGHSSREQLKIYYVLAKASDGIRKLAQPAQDGKGRA